MPWITPSLREVRELTRDQIAGTLPGADATVPNSVLRVMADAQAGLAHLNLLYLDWLALQLMPDTSEVEWLDRHGEIWLKNADGSKGRKVATFATGTATVAGTAGAVVPAGAVLVGGNNLEFEVLDEATVSAASTTLSIRALDPGIAGNLPPGAALTFQAGLAGVDGSATVFLLDGGTDRESDDLLRARVLERIQQPPMGGAAHDYVQWAKDVAGVTRAWAAPLEMGIGTVTVRFMMDDLRATALPWTDGFPLPDDRDAVADYLDQVRPVAVKDFFVEIPLAEPIDFTISNLDSDDASTRENIAASVRKMIKERAAPASAQDGVLISATTIYAAWVSEAISQAVGVKSFNLTMADHPMPSGGSLAVLGTILYD